MKRYGNLYEKIISMDNLRLADTKARRGKLHTYGVRQFDLRREENLEALHETLEKGEFRTSPYETFTIYEPKEREIARLPYYPDRIVHHAIMNVLEPIWRKTFISQTYSSINGRGIHACMKQMDKYMKDKEGTLYCLKVDVRKFYPSIDHETMKAIVRKKIKCKRTLALLDELIDSFDGMPIGNYTSSFLANLYLTYLDHYIKEELKVKYYLRYADDMVFLSGSKEQLREVLDAVRRYLREELKLELKDNYQIFRVAERRGDRHGRGVDFVGFVFYHYQKLMRKSIKKNFCRAAARCHKRKKPLPLEVYKQRLCSWFGWAKYSDSKHLMKVIIKPKYYEVIFKRRAA